MSVSTDLAVEPTPGATRVSRSPSGNEATAFGRAFWYAYVANSAFTVAMSLMYRYADFVLYLGGTEWNVGLIVGIGMVGSLVMRFFQGFGIDHFGARRIWLWSTALFIVSLLAHVMIRTVDGPAIFLLRIVYTTSVAGYFGASITSVSRSLPLARMAEVIGLLGTSGFIGMALGPRLGDMLFGHEPITRWDLDLMFYLAAGLGVVSLVCGELATRHEPPPRRRRRPPLLWLLKRYHPGSVMLLGVVMGIGFTIPNTFLPTFIRELHIEETGPFFLVYASTAFLARVGTRRFPEMFGVRPMVYLGMASLVVSLLTYLPVQSQWGLAIPGVFAGISHAVLFPAVTAQGSVSFPNRYRGLGTTLMLAMLDIGALVGAPLIGSLVEVSKGLGWAPYSTTFMLLSAGVAVSSVVYGLTARR